MYSGNLFLMIDSLEVTHELIFTIQSVIQISSISSIDSIRLRFNLGKPRLISIVPFTPSIGININTGVKNQMGSYAWCEYGLNNFF